ncbi:hypothetical protein PMI06_001835 [Burkholderia sp. BT03]|nr:hypothetical protein PMI06_001835 [Burkholderia sp. BT03]SKD06155.1 hypothetical protein SAMN06266956_9227 [Paraburkholderia hospita]
MPASRRVILVRQIAVFILMYGARTQFTTVVRHIIILMRDAGKPHRLPNLLEERVCLWLVILQTFLMENRYEPGVVFGVGKF